MESEQPAAPPPPAVMAEGDTVVFDINGDKHIFIALDGNSKVKLCGVQCSAAPLIGAPWGSMWTLDPDGKSLQRTSYTPLADWDPLPADDPEFNTRTNAGIEYMGQQALTTAEIEGMKREGKAGQEIVAALTAGSATFAAKTEFSQAKYRKKKAKKYIQVGTARRPSAATVAAAYFASTPKASGYLRPDALALLLSLANVGPHARVLVVETCGGLVTAAALERCGGAASPGAGVASAWVGAPGTKRPPLDMWRHFNFSAEQRAALRFAPLCTLREEAAQEKQRRQQQQQQQQQAAAEDGSAEPMQQEVDAQPAAEQQQQEPEQQHAAAAASGAPPAAAQAAAQAGGGGGDKLPVLPPFNSCILAAGHVQPLALIQHVLPLLAPSACLAVYSPWVQPLADALDAFKGGNQVAGLALSECWWRDMQVLPLRTHPTMNMNHGHGFILTGTVLAAEPEPQPAAARQ